MLTNQRRMIGVVLGLGVVLGYGAAAEQAKQPASVSSDKPNIVFMMADNLGYGEVGCYGGGILRGAPTPRIDKLATEGFRLLNYNVEPQCTPSRSALMTGRFPLRSGTMRVNRGGALYGLTQWEITMAEVLAQRGYATGHFGKWHLGATEGRFPTNQGFDEWYGIPCDLNHRLAALAKRWFKSRDRARFW
jgi:arylsulfatase A-like enzyme